MGGDVTHIVGRQAILGKQVLAVAVGAIPAHRPTCLRRRPERAVYPHHTPHVIAIGEGQPGRDGLGVGGCTWRDAEEEQSQAEEAEEDG